MHIKCIRLIFSVMAGFVVACGCLYAHSQSGANAGENASDAAVRGNPAIAPVADVPGLPRVLLIGDSISIGYTLEVRELLKGKANVHRPPFNCGASYNGLLGTRGKWLGQGQWDVIHFNFGIWDSKINPKTGKLATSDKNYINNLRVIARQLKETGAVVVFATTTPIPDSLLIEHEPLHPLDAHARVFIDVAPRNELAVEALSAEGVLINDLYAAIYPQRETYWRAGDLHFTRDGSSALAEQVANSIESALAARSK